MSRSVGWAGREYVIGHRLPRTPPFSLFVCLCLSLSLSLSPSLPSFFFLPISRGACYVCSAPSRAPSLLCLSLENVSLLSSFSPVFPSSFTSPSTRQHTPTPTHSLTHSHAPFSLQTRVTPASLLFFCLAISSSSLPLSLFFSFFSISSCPSRPHSNYPTIPCNISLFSLPPHLPPSHLFSPFFLSPTLSRRDFSSFLSKQRKWTSKPHKKSKTNQCHTHTHTGHKYTTHKQTFRQLSLSVS